MSEFPVSNLEKRLFWGIACGAGAMLLSFCVPLLSLILLAKIGVDPQLPNQQNQQGPYAGMGFGILLFAGVFFCGLVGLIAGLVRPGVQGAAISTGGLFLADILLMVVATRLFFVSAAVKVACVILIGWRLQARSEPPSPS
jgi:hypothetical protein